MSDFLDFRTNLVSYSIKQIKRRVGIYSVSQIPTLALATFGLLLKNDNRRFN